MSATPAAAAATSAAPDPREGFDITGRVAVVTGGSRGLGRAMALGLARCGARVVVTARTAADCEAVVAEISAWGGEALAVAADVGDLDDGRRIVARTVEHFGALDILVNNAGITRHVPIERIDESVYDLVQAVNIKGPVFLAQAALPHLSRSGHGAVVNVLSVGVWNAGPPRLLYRTSKAALLAATMVMAREWADRGIRVNAIAPGTFDTDMVAEHLTSEARAGAVARTPLHRVADPAEIVPAVLYLVSDAASFVTGEVLRIDGGMLSM